PGRRVPQAVRAGAGQGDEGAARTDIAAVRAQAGDQGIETRRQRRLAGEELAERHGPAHSSASRGCAATTPAVRRSLAARAAYHCSMASGGTSISRSAPSIDRKSTRLNSSHVKISYAVFCL